jgi:uncharacterized protein YdhG (YjbR/CyaY superfamily)
MNGEVKSIDEYIGSFPEEVQQKLEEIRALINEIAPKAKERISYQMPAFDQNGIIVYFAAFSNHIGFYPTSSGVTAFESELGDYKHSKGAIQFPLDKPLPIELIRKIVQYRLKENLSSR